MADNIEAQIPTGPNGERLELRVGSKAFGVTSKDLLALVALLLLGGLMYFGQTRGFAGLSAIIDQANQHQLQLLEKMAGNQSVLIELVHTNRTEMTNELRQQNTLVHNQTTALDAKVDTQTTALEARFERLDKMLAILDHNSSRPAEEHLPLTLDPAQCPQTPQHR